MFGVLSLLIDVALAIGAAAPPSDDLDARYYVDEDDSDDGFAFGPLVDVVEEEGELVVLIEIPGFYSQDVRFKVLEDILVLADSEDREFHEIMLPRGYKLDRPTCVRFNNGIITIRYRKAPVPCAQRKIA